MNEFETVSVEEMSRVEGGNKVWDTIKDFFKAGVGKALDYVVEKGIEWFAKNVVPGGAPRPM